MVALNLGTIIVLILAALFFGGIIFLASKSGAAKQENGPVVMENRLDTPAAPAKNKRRLHQAM